MFVRERTPAAAIAAAAAGIAQEATTIPESGTAVAGDMAATAALPRRVPRAVLRPALELCKETPVELGSGSRVIIMPDSGGVSEALLKRLQKRKVEILELASDMSRTEVTESIDGWLQQGPIQGMYWLPALDVESAIVDMDLAQWRQQLELRVKLLYSACYALYEHFDEGGRFLLVATRLGGRHGYDEDGAVAAMGGAVTGFAKAFARERGNALVKAVDFSASRKTAALADVLIEETLRDPGAVEVGHCQDLRWCVSLAEQPVEDGGQGLAAR